MFKLSFDTDNDAFAKYPWIEAARILTEIARKLEDRADGGVVKDDNGNTIGEWEFLPGS